MARACLNSTTIFSHAQVRVCGWRRVGEWVGGLCGLVMGWVAWYVPISLGKLGRFDGLLRFALCVGERWDPEWW